MTSSERRPLFWIASSRRDLKAMPAPVQKKFGTALLDVQYGDTPGNAKPLKGLGSQSTGSLRPRGTSIW